MTHYVGSRNDLLALAVEREAAAWRAEISAAASGLRGRDRVRAIVSAAVVGGSDEQRLAWLAITLAAVQDEVVARSVQSFNDWWDAELAEAVTESGLDGRRSGWAQTIVDVIVAGMIVNAFESPGQWSRATAQEAVVRLIDLALGSGVPAIMPRSRRPLPRAGPNEPCLVGGDHGLGTVADVEFHEDGGDMGLDGLHGHHQIVCDLGVGHADGRAGEGRLARGRTARAAA